MKDQPNRTQDKVLFLLQVVSVSLIWVFVITISVWILNLILLSLELQDVPGASLGISIVAIPVFLTLAGLLTYVFVGLRREKSPPNQSEEK
jgi:flagellar basal body-associated protein FliL